MIILGLTGSVGMGKSTVARLFAETGIPVYSADDAVHILYHQKPVIREIATAFPDAVANNIIDHGKLGAIVFGKPELLHKLEAIIHPRVRKLETEFLQEAQRQGHKIVVLDIPLLFETGNQNRVDKVIVVSTPFETQRRRVLKRPGMTEEKFSAILAHQLPDEEKRKRADFVIDTTKSLETVRQEVCTVIKALLAL